MSNLLAMLSRTINGSTAVIPTDDTRVYTLLETVDNNVYYLSSYLVHNPISGKTLNVFTSGDYHISAQDKKIVYRESSDLAQTFGAINTLYDPPDAEPMQVQDLAVGYDSNGRLHVMVDIHENISSTGVFHELRYFYSDDDGATISTPVAIPFPVTTSLPTMRVRSHIRQNGNTLMCCAHFFTEEGDFTSVECYALRSTDLGANWTWIDQNNDATKQISESDLLHIQGDLWIQVSREEITKGMWMFKSPDDGLTWEDCGAFSLEQSMTLAHPPMLHKFKENDGTDVAVLYYGDRGTDGLYAIYAKCSNFVEGGVGAWNLSTKALLRQDTEWLHYGDMFHYNNNMNARGAWIREASSAPLEDNTMVYFENRSTQYATVYSILAPTSIYDLLNGTKAIYTWRGLVSNTSNDWGTVDSSNRITLLKSLTPGPTGKNLSATAGGILLGDGMEFDGTKALTTDDSSYWQPQSYSSAGDTDLNYTIYFTAKFGTGSNPNAAYALYGNNGLSSANKGAAMMFDDRLAQSRNNSFCIFISKGSAGTFQLLVRMDNIITPNTKFVGCIRIDMSLSGNNKVKFSINGVDQAITVEAYNGSGVATPTYSFQLGAGGNNQLIMVGSIYDWIWQNAIDIPSVRNKLISDLMDLEGL